MPVHHPEAAASLARAMFDTSRLPMLLLDGHLKIAAATPSFCEGFDIAEADADGRTLAELGDGEWNMPELLGMVADPDRGAWETDLVRAGRDPRRVILRAKAVIHGDADDARVLLTIDDVTEVRTVEALNVALLLEKDSMLRDRATLILEMRHRVANSLQIIASVLVLKARMVKSDEAREHLRDAHSRVMSMAAVQRLLESSLGDVEIAPYLAKLCETLAASMISDSQDLSIEVRADAVTVTSQKAVSLGLVVTELVINALKHAFPKGRKGRIRVEYDADSDGWALSVADDGVGRAASVAAETGGLGTIVIESIARQLGAEVTNTDAGPGARIVLRSVPGGAAAADPMAGEIA